MLSLRTIEELTHVLDKLSRSEMERLYTVFGLTDLLYPADPKMTTAKRANVLMQLMLSPSMKKGPYSESLAFDVLQYVVNKYFREKGDPERHATYNKTNQELFLDTHAHLINALKRDGFAINGTEIKKVLPEEIVEAKIETELIQLLDEFNFNRSKGHLEQAVDNHTKSLWASANSQFRTFIESLLIEICSTLLPSHSCSTAGAAINLLSNTVSPPFLQKDLNEVESPRCDKPFVEGLFKRLHPEGSHPGLSDEEDSTFRYHITIVFAHYLLKRLQSRSKA